MMIMKADSSTPLHPVGIDYALHPIASHISGKPNALYQAYLKRVRKLISVLRLVYETAHLKQMDGLHDGRIEEEKGKGEKGRGGSEIWLSERRLEWFSSVQSAFEHHLGYTLSPSNRFALERGILEGADRMCSVDDGLLKKISLYVDNLLHPSSLSQPLSSPSSPVNSQSPRGSPLSYQICLDVIDIYREVLSDTHENLREYLCALDAQAQQKLAHDAVARSSSLKGADKKVRKHHCLVM